jgi:hypothetical protein
LEEIKKSVCNHKVVNNECTHTLTSEFISNPEGFLKEGTGTYLTKEEEDSPYCARVKRFPINQEKTLIAFDEKVQLLDNKEIDWFIVASFTESLSLLPAIMYLYDCYDENQNSYHFKYFFMVEKINLKLN